MSLGSLVACNISASHQVLERLYFGGKAICNFKIFPSHLPGSSNLVADAGLRSLTEPYKSNWSILSRDWNKVIVDRKTHLNVLDELQSCALTLTSRKHYQETWAQWCGWCLKLGFGPWTSNVPTIYSEGLVMFAVYCY
ncbi:LOW QUALITY PROTEIN: hypothetical protein PHMEG_00020778 [Phytophthora megakarya]|uniref:Uncharacterized protein n=1 Tax=Phytophthora megakarya TaxID=4795 RepID=A0A225VNJ3_9STRA|nr:LOW QUALITY PROTEIN: hypothetical protein PHMEG_00020778 [Phytophthora megakarya]